MMYPYMTLDDGTEIVHSQLISKDGTDHVIVHFERPTEDGFDDARCELPSYTWTDVHGFSKEELALFDEMVRANAHLFYKYAACGGIESALGNAEAASPHRHPERSRGIPLAGRKTLDV